MDIRLKTALVIRKDGKYLVGKVIYSNEMKWSDSPWDAWQTRVRAKARSIQEKVGGDIMLFNPITGQIRKAELN